MEQKWELDCSATPDTAALDEAGRSLFRLGRAFSRLPRRDLLPPATARDVELSAILVVQAIEAGEAAGREVTIGLVAAQLGVDPSTASRLVAQAVEAGYVRRISAHSDKRAAALELTEEGLALGAGAAHYQRAVFVAATAGWSDDERRRFARLFIRFAEAIVAEVKNQDRPR